MNTQRKGQSLVEFALVALVLYLLLGAIFTFGHTLYVAQQVQLSADLLAREVSRTPASVTAPSLREVLRTETIENSLFRESLLIYEYSEGENLAETIQSWPLVNRQLSVVMVDDGETIRIPGARERQIGGQPRIQIARTFDADFSEDGDWIDVVEELVDESGDSVFPPMTDRGGVVALRINYPVHSAFLTAMESPLADSQFGDPNTKFIEVSNPSSEFNVGAPNRLDPRVELYGGENGLGRQYAWGSQVRPYRRIVTGQAIYLREIFTP